MIDDLFKLSVYLAGSVTGRKRQSVVTLRSDSTSKKQSNVERELANDEGGRHGEVHRVELFEVIEMRLTTFH